MRLFSLVLLYSTSSQHSSCAFLSQRSVLQNLVGIFKIWGIIRYVHDSVLIISQYSLIRIQRVYYKETAQSHGFFTIKWTFYIKEYLFFYIPTSLHLLLGFIRSTAGNNRVNSHSVVAAGEWVQKSHRQTKPNSEMILRAAPLAIPLSHRRN